MPNVEYIESGNLLKMRGHDTDVFKAECRINDEWLMPNVEYIESGNQLKMSWHDTDVFKVECRINDECLNDEWKDEWGND